MTYLSTLPELKTGESHMLFIIICDKVGNPVSNVQIYLISNDLLSSRS